MHQRRKLFHDGNFYLWDEPFLYKIGLDKIIGRCVPEVEAQNVLEDCHEIFPYMESNLAVSERQQCWILCSKIHSLYKVNKIIMLPLMFI